MFLLTISYILTLKNKENNREINYIIENNIDKEKKLSSLQQNNSNITLIQKYLNIFIIIIAIIGFLSYLGSKKAEYGSNFSYLTFVFGKTTCADDGNKLSYFNGLKNIFS